MSDSITHIFKHDVQSILDTFTSLLAIRTALFTPSGEEVKVGFDKPWCSYCALLRKELSLDENCRAIDNEMMEQARKSGETVSYTCHSGMKEVIIPLFLETSLIGFMMIGQFRNSDKPPENILALWKRKIRDSRIEEAFRQAPVYTEEKTERIIALFSLLTEYIMSNHLINTQGTASFDSLISYMKNNLDTPFGLPDAAAMLGKSISATAGLFRQKRGKSFKKVQGEMKMARAVELIRKRPRLRVQEIADELGFSDPLYFSRFFKKHTGISPILFQKSHF